MRNILHDINRIDGYILTFISVFLHILIINWGVTLQISSATQHLLLIQLKKFAEYATDFVWRSLCVQCYQLGKLVYTVVMLHRDEV